MSQHQYYDLGHHQRGETVEVILSGDAANVLLLDSGNYQAYKSGRQYRYFGGRATRSPIHIPIPHAGRWYVVVDFGGFPGRVTTKVNVLPAPLPEIRPAPLASVPGLVREKPPLPDRETGETYDVFISHASEDKDEVARPLAEALREQGVRVWLDDFELKIGDSLRRKIDRGLAGSRMGLVVLSQSFIKKGWTNYELDGIVTRAVSGEQVLLPVWHDITKEQVVAFSPSLADKVARNTATCTIQEIADEIAGLL